ncbi:MAG TPA: TonB-dependent receptor, partial [Steroidobacteraceae bacterium]
MNHRSLTVLLLCLLAALAPGIAAADLASKTHFDIPAQELPTALLKFSEQSGIQVSSPGELIEGKRSSGVQGTFTARAALDKLLDRTQLTFASIDPNTVTIRPAALPNSPLAASKPDSDPSAHPARAESSRTPAESTAEKPADASFDQRKALQLEEVTVTGSRIPHPEAEGPVAVKIATQEDIQRTGASNVAEFLNTLPEVSVSVQENSFQGQGYGTTVRLRGLPLGATLVLINGRRVGPSGMNYGTGDYLDLDTIPVSAIERIEVLAQGASAIYGADALAGVVNIVLKKDFDGLEANAKYGSTSDGATGTSQADLAWGHKWSRGSISLIGSYLDTTPLIGADRAITSMSDFTRFGGPNYTGSGGNPANVYSANGQNLPGLNAP